MHQYIISVATLIVGSTLHWPIRLGLPVTQFSHFFDEKKNHQISQVFKLMYEYHASAYTYIYIIYIMEVIEGLNTKWSYLPLTSAAVLWKDVHSGRGDSPARVRRLFA